MHQNIITFVYIGLFICGFIITPAIFADVQDSSDNEIYEGYILFAPEYSTKTFLLDMNNDIIHSWDSEYMQGLPVYLLENGNLIRGCSKLNNPMVGGGFTGRVEIMDWSGTLLWEFDYSNTKHCLHHDIEVLPNGNVLMIAWEHKSKYEATNAGINPNNLPENELWVDHIIEVEPTGKSGGNIVWEWHVWDHLIQDYDSTKENFGIISEHPELVDINCAPGRIDFNHINSIDYNEELDQILLSSNQQNEIWIIDHNTTTKEAAGHTGGRYGKGGDLLYRWGNPQIYNRGSILDKILFGQHDAQWIEKGYPGEGNILIFNNGVGRPNGRYSTIDEILPPITNNGSYYLPAYKAFGPEEIIWQYKAPNPSTFFASHISGADRLPNGNTLICNGEKGYFFEVNHEKETVWEYQNSYPNPSISQVFKIHKYGPEYPGLGKLYKQPDKPDIQGPSVGSIDIKYTFISETNDPEDDDVYYYFDWGDDTNSGWLGPYTSGKECHAGHSWQEKGDFKVKVKAKDIHGLESEWSESLTISMPKNRFQFTELLDFIEENEYLIQLLKYVILINS